MKHASHERAKLTVHHRQFQQYVPRSAVEETKRSLHIWLEFSTAPLVILYRYLISSRYMTVVTKQLQVNFRRNSRKQRKV
jgi:hypothetical protein